jgi:hypothetical protein
MPACSRIQEIFQELRVPKHLNMRGGQRTPPLISQGDLGLIFVLSDNDLQPQQDPSTHARTRGFNAYQSCDPRRGSPMQMVLALMLNYHVRSSVSAFGRA